MITIDAIAQVYTAQLLSRITDSWRINLLSTDQKSSSQPMIKTKLEYTFNLTQLINSY